MLPSPGKSSLVTRKYASQSPRIVPEVTPSIVTNDDSMQEAERDCALLVADRAQHADLLAPLDDGAEGDHADRRDADDEAERP